MNNNYDRPVDNARLLAKLVRSRPELYDPDHGDYSNRFAHAKAWKELAAKMGVPVADFRAKWSSLRNSYARCIKTKMEHPDRPRTKWYLEDHMNFLQKHILYKTKRRQYLLNFGMNSTSASNDTTKDETQLDGDGSYKDDERNFKDYDDDEIDIKIVNDINETPNGNDSYLNNNDLIQNIKKQKLNGDELVEDDFKSDEFDKLFKSVTGFFETQTIQLKQNSDDLFFQSIENDYGKLSDKRKRKFKLIALNALNDLLDESD